jgi:hypothetical protein
VTVTDEQIRELLATYVHCRRFAQTGYVGSNAVTIIAALEELLERRANDIPQRVAGAEEVHGRSRQSQKDDLGAASTRWASSVSSSKRWPQGTDG